MPQIAITGDITLQNEVVEVVVTGDYEPYQTNNPMDIYIRVTKELLKNRNKKEETD